MSDERLKITIEVIPENVNGLTFEWNAKDYENTQKYHLNKCIVHLARERERETANDGQCVLYSTGQNKNQLPSKQSARNRRETL